MEDCDGALTNAVIHKVVRDVYRGISVDKAFERAGVDAEIGREWLLDGARFDHYAKCYALRRSVDDCLNPTVVERMEREMMAAVFPPDSLGGRMIDKIIDRMMGLDKRRERGRRRSR